MSGNYTFSLGIPHSPWMPGRPASLERLILSLSQEGHIHPESSLPSAHYSETPKYTVFSDKAPNHVWSSDMWGWGAEHDTTHFLTLQDDAIVTRNFWECLDAIVGEYPNHVVGLQVAHPASKAVLDDGHAFFTTSDAVVGVGYCIPTGLLKKFLFWRGESLREGAVEALSEDSLLGLWCLVTGRKVVHPVPAIVTHDVSLVSSYNNDAHQNRVSSTFSDKADGMYDFTDEGPSETYTPPHLGSMFPNLIRQAEKWVLDWSSVDTQRAQKDNGAHEIKRLAHATRARHHAAPTSSVLVCTPMRGGLGAEYSASIWRLLNHVGLDVTNALDVVDVQLWHEDVVRVRSRFVEYFLAKTTATHLLFVDSDVSFAPVALEGMLRSGHDFVACPYPRRDVIDVARVRAHAVEQSRGAPTIPWEASAYRFACRIAGELKIDPATHCVPVAGVPMGCTLLSRPLLQKMRDLYPSLSFRDTMPYTEEPIDTVALFQLLFHEGVLLSEDFSFCQRAVECGFRPQLYLGPGSPVAHEGMHTYQGVIESFGFSRKVAL